MINFFRKIRYKLAQENQFLKYGRYAVGEILLVVIGILIALQINNWNENRKTAKQEIKILKELKNDLETNRKEIEESHATTVDRARATALILNYFEKAKPFDDSLKQAFELLSMDVLFNIANTSYKYIESQGFNSLSNDSLRIRVTEMFERHLKNIVMRENLNRQMVNDDLMPLVYVHFLSSPTADKTLSYAIEVINTPKNLESLSQDPEFKNVIIRLQGFLLMRINWQKEALQSVTQLIQDVENEIDHLSR